MEAPEGFRNCDEECLSESQVTGIMGFLPEACDLTVIPAAPLLSLKGVQRGGRSGLE